MKINKSNFFLLTVRDKEVIVWLYVRLIQNVFSLWVNRQVFDKLYGFPYNID